VRSHSVDVPYVPLTDWPCFWQRMVMNAPSETEPTARAARARTGATVSARLRVDAARYAAATVRRPVVALLELALHVRLRRR